MTSPIQIPYLRDLPIHEGAGLQQAGGEDQLSQLAKLLMLKGHLSLEQEKFQAEEGARKEKKQTLAQLSQTLSGLFQGAQTPDQLQSATAASVGPLAGAGETAGAAAAIHDLPGLQKQTQLSATQKALGQVMQQFQAGDVMDQKNQARAYAQTYALDQNAGREFAEGLKSLGGRFTFYTDLAGQHWIGDTQRGTEHMGALGAPRSGQHGGSVPMSSLEAQDTAKLLAQSLANVESMYGKDKAALTVPWGYAGISNAKASGGVTGALAGLIEPFAQTQLQPHQKIVMRDRDMAIETYMALITGKRGAGSPGLLAIARNSLFPMAGQDEPEVQAAASRTRRMVIAIATDLANGINVSGRVAQLPGYNQAIREQLGLEGASAPEATPNLPSAAGQAPLGFGDLLKGVPTVNQKP